MPGEETTEFSQAILQEARKEAEELMGRSRHEAEHILGTANSELDKVYRAEMSVEKTQATKLRYNQIIASAELHAQRQLLFSQERLLTEIQEQFEHRLLQIRKEPQYGDLLAALIRQGLTELEGETFEVFVAPEDRALVTPEMLAGLRERTGKNVMLAAQSQPGITGAIVQRGDHRVLCDNSLQAMFQRQRNELRLLIAQELFAGITEM